MSGLRGVDRMIGVVLLLVLAGLVGLGVSENRVAAAPAALGGSVAASSAAGTTTLTPTSGRPPQPTGADATPSALPTTSTTTAPTTPVPVAGPVTAIGDSIMLDVQPALTTTIPGVTVDGVVSRQFDAGVAVVQADRAAGTLGRVLVVELGTNGAVTPSDVDAMMQAAQGVARVVFVNVCVPRAWAAGDNAVLAAGVARYPDVAVLADWNALATPHPEWFTADQVHLAPAGVTALAALIAQLA